MATLRAKLPPGLQADHFHHGHATVPVRQGYAEVDESEADVLELLRAQYGLGEVKRVAGDEARPKRARKPRAARRRQPQKPKPAPAAETSQQEA